MRFTGAQTVAMGSAAGVDLFDREVRRTRRAYAVVRWPGDRDGRLWNLVGFQTLEVGRSRSGVFRLIWLENAFVRFGVIAPQHLLEAPNCWSQLGSFGGGHPAGRRSDPGPRATPQPVAGGCWLGTKQPTGQGRGGR